MAGLYRGCGRTAHLIRWSDVPGLYKEPLAIACPIFEWCRLQSLLQFDSYWTNTETQYWVLEKLYNHLPIR